MFLEKFGGEMNADYLQKQFAGLGLTAFTEHMEKLARIWLQGEPGEAFYQQLFDYMQGCGIYGKDETVSGTGSAMRSRRREKRAEMP